MTSLATLRHLAVAGAMIIALGACGSASAPNSTAALTPTAAPIATSSATPTAVPAACTQPTVTWNYSRDRIVQAFIDKFALTFGAPLPAASGYSYVESKFTAGGIQVFVTSKVDGTGVRVVGVIDTSNGPAASEEAIFALGLMVDPNAVDEATIWVQGEFGKAYADKSSSFGDIKTIGCALLAIHARDDRNPKGIYLGMEKGR